MTTLTQDIKEIIADYQKVRNDIIHNHSVLNKVAETLYFLKTEKMGYNNIPAYSTSNDLEISRQNKAKGYENATLTDSLIDILAYRGIGAGYSTFYVGKSRALFKNYFHALARIVNKCELNIYLECNSPIMGYWFEDDALSRLQDFVPDLLRKDESITVFQFNVGGVKIDVNLTKFRQAVANMKERIYLYLQDENIVDLFIHLYLNDILAQFPNIENDDEVLAFLSITDKEHTNQAILKIEEKLAKLGVTQLFGEFTLQSELNVCDVATYVSKMNEVIYSTTGSLDSSFRDLVEKHLTQYENLFKVYPDHSFMFEICDETDIHIIREEFGAYLIGCRNVANGKHLTEEQLDDIAKEYDIKRPYHKIVTFGELKDELKTCQHEGYMVYSLDGTKRFKMKSPHYLISKFLGRGKNENLETKLANKALLDEEFYPLVDYVTANIDEFKSLDELGKIAYIQEFLKRM